MGSTVESRRRVRVAGKPSDEPSRKGEAQSLTDFVPFEAARARGDRVYGYPPSLDLSRGTIYLADKFVGLRSCTCIQFNNTLDNRTGRCDQATHPRALKSANISLVDSSLLLTLIPRIFSLFSFE